MGTDIHGIFQRHNGKGWQDVPSRYEERRQYQLFAVLADVRNGVGFAGIKRGDPIEPIAQPRGLPADFEIEDGEHRTSKEVWDKSRHALYTKEGEEGYGRIWMGDHSHSWLTGEEMLAWIEQAPIVRHFGVISREEFQTWPKGTEPANGYSGWVSGKDISVIEQADVEAGASGTHVRVSWHSALRKELADFFDEVARLVAQHGRIRFVFGFDS